MTYCSSISFHVEVNGTREKKQKAKQLMNACPSGAAARRYSSRQAVHTGVGVVSWALMHHGKAGYKEFLESLIVPEFTPRLRSYF